MGCSMLYQNIVTIVKTSYLLLAPSAWLHKRYTYQLVIISNVHMFRVKPLPLSVVTQPNRYICISVNLNMFISVNAFFFFVHEGPKQLYRVTMFDKANKLFVCPVHVSSKGRVGRSDFFCNVAHDYIVHLQNENYIILYKQTGLNFILTN